MRWESALLALKFDRSRRVAVTSTRVRDVTMSRGHGVDANRASGRRVDMDTPLPRATLGQRGHDGQRCGWQDALRTFAHTPIDSHHQAAPTDSHHCRYAHLLPPTATPSSKASMALAQNLVKGPRASFCKTATEEVEEDAVEVDSRLQGLQDWDRGGGGREEVEEDAVEVDSRWQGLQDCGRGGGGGRG
eukprot:358984-Chlamydomonas_euryale.AAC.5